MLLFIPALLVNRLTDPDNKTKRPVYIIGAAGAILFMAGFLFKIQHWPFATLFMVASIILLTIVALPWYTWLTWKEENHVNPMFIYLVVGSLLIIMPGALVSLNLQHSYQEYYYPNSIKQNELFDYLYMKNSFIVSRYRDSVNYHKIEQLHSKTIGVISLINNIQEKMVQESEGESGNPALAARQIRKTESGTEIAFRELSWAIDPGPARNFLFPGCNARNELDEVINEYVNFLGDLVPAASLQQYRKVFDTESFLPAGKMDEGITTLITGLHTLQVMKNGILTVESSILNGMIRHN
jgi:hypothetical protein